MEIVHKNMVHVTAEGISARIQNSTIPSNFAKGKEVTGTWSVIYLALKKKLFKKCTWKKLNAELWENANQSAYMCPYKGLGVKVYNNWKQIQ